MRINRDYREATKSGRINAPESAIQVEIDRIDALGLAGDEPKHGGGRKPKYGRCSIDGVIYTSLKRAAVSVGYVLTCGPKTCEAIYNGIKPMNGKFVVRLEG